MKTILVQMSEKQWTMPALHLACALARNTQAQIILLRLMTLAHPSYLGSEFGFSIPTSQECEDIAEYKATAEDYDVTRRFLSSNWRRLKAYHPNSISYLT